jgi:hypothetical protein
MGQIYVKSLYLSTFIQKNLSPCSSLVGRGRGEVPAKPTSKPVRFLKPAMSGRKVLYYP